MVKFETLLDIMPYLIINKNICAHLKYIECVQNILNVLKGKGHKNLNNVKTIGRFFKYLYFISM